ncbi:MAG: glutamate 5-kinase [Nisaea sp.]|uniref:glutamate 5-kinase n=1 Tax=Nisaea sp. TaxID=2024842 RepID=UPI001B0D4EA3|nr:glutamate 5-kinase [Nisaea sp.]MBO6559877.1 glutamate 5-kinase [Nisaea sp.]
MSPEAAETGTRSGLDTAERIVVKIGSALLVDEKGGEIRRDWLNALADDIAGLKARGKQVLVVSSGAIAVGRRLLGLPKGALKLEDKQAAAATGQVRLAHAYQEALARHGIMAAQILLSPGDTEERRRHLNARATLNALLALGAVPVINENDTVATEEIRYGDNDRLGARVAQMVMADTLILLSDIDGLYTADPRSNPAAEHIPHVERIDEGIEAMAGTVGSEYASGGMVTKLAAGKIASAAGCRMAIARGHDPHPLKAIEEGTRVTWFAAATSPRGARKNWIAGSLTPKGSVSLDEGALKALKRGKSLLPAGVTEVGGNFERGDLIEILDAEGRPVARGLSAYGAADARRIAGHKSREIERILGYRGRDELVHRDDLVLDR